MICLNTWNDGTDPPEIIEPPRDGAVRSGGIAAFYCRAKGDPTPQLSWRKNGRKVITESFIFLNATIVWHVFNKVLFSKRRKNVLIWRFGCPTRRNDYRSDYGIASRGLNPNPQQPSIHYLFSEGRIDWRPIDGHIFIFSCSFSCLNFLGLFFYVSSTPLP